MSTLAVPDGYTVHKENSAQILLNKDEAFLNPVQEFNRDLSIACIRVWSEELAKSKQEKWEQRMEKKETKKRRIEANPSEPQAETSQEVEKGQPYKFTLLEPLSATGLRSIRYAKEIPLVKQVIANDLSPAATAAIRRNLEINELAPSIEEGAEEKVKVVEGDACALMYSHRDPKSRVDVVDLDPYGSAAPFIDAAVQCVNEDGLLCITCTDLSVLATVNYPEKCFSNYGGVPVKAEYCHESALRLVLHSVSTSASRYGRYIEPLVSLSIDFYVRIFVRVRSSPLEVKKALTKTANYYVCSSCQTPYEQPLGKVVEKTAAAGNVNYNFKIQNGPLTPERCSECQSTLHIAGPMWSGPLHNVEFTSKVLEHLEANQDNYGTATRMKGMLTVAKEELNNPFYFTPAKMASFFHCSTPSLEEVASAILHSGHQISRSHACAGSLKTTAPRSVLHSIYRSWTKSNPVKMENIPERSPARQLLAKEPDFEANFTKHPNTVTPSSKVKLVRYQENPTPNWGPGTKAGASKRKRTD